MAWKAVVGATFCLRPSLSQAEHLFFVLNNPMDFEGLPKQSCLLVNASTPNGRHDTTCIIPAQCHPFIGHDSFMYYRYARIEKADFLEANVLSDEPQYRAHDPVPLKLIAFILSRMVLSPQASADNKKYAELALAQLGLQA